MGEKTVSNRIPAPEFVEFSTAAEPLSSADLLRQGFQDKTPPEDVPSVPVVETAELSPVFRELAAPTLPVLNKQNRARLLMQSPNRLYFYWSIKSNPFQTLKRALGPDTGSYTLVLRLVDLERGIEEIHPAGADGSWWFDVGANGEYRAEMGFYAPNRPFVRILFSNTVRTPRQAPSPRPAAESAWKLPAEKFSRVLQAAGFARDAFDVAVAGDDPEAADQITRMAFSRLAGSDEGLDAFSAEDLRLVLFLLASGTSLEALRRRIAPRLFSILQAGTERLSDQHAIAVLREEFGIEADEIIGEESSAAVFGASLVNFPRVLRERMSVPSDLAPLSSFSL